MNLNEEQGERKQQGWLARMTQERQDHSISIGETLDDPILQKLYWIDEDSEPSSFYPGLPQQRESIFPPRLSLQSRMGVTVQSDEESITSAQTKHLTSAYSVPGSAPVTSVPATETGTTGPLSPLLSSQSFPSFMGQKASSLAAIADIEVCTASTTGKFSVREFTHDMFPTPSLGSLPGSLPGSIPGSLSAVRLERMSEQRRPDSQKKRLAGHHTRVRLEVAPGTQNSKQGPQSRSQTGTPLPTIPPSVARYETIQSAQKQAASPLIPPRPAPSSLGQRAGAAMMPNTRRAALPRQDEEIRRITWERLQAVATNKGVVGATARGALSGGGYFMRGQSEVTINNPYVTERSVILVTLTSNPGPTVVQYVSLKPQAGFTVHLTAPTMQRTSFNYILLLGELF